MCARSAGQETVGDAMRGLFGRRQDGIGGSSMRIPIEIDLKLLGGDA
jgi:hypothetical protein